MAPTYQHDPDAAPDSDFESGRLHHLVPGNRGRMLDPRRTPVVVVGMGTGVGFFELEVAAFEDTGAKWSIPLEGIGRFQFERGSARLGRQDVRALEALRRQADRPLVVPIDAQTRAATLSDLRRFTADAADWLAGESQFRSAPVLDLTADRGSEVLAADLTRFMTAVGLEEVEGAFAATYVSNPGSGDVVRGHEIAAARLGLAPYDGKALRDPAASEGIWEEGTRGRHLLNRLAFVSAAYRLAGYERTTVYRSLAFQGPVRESRHHTFVSATFARAVAEDLFWGGENVIWAVLYRQDVAVGRLLMTYQETAAMNRQFHEAEAVLLADPDNQAF